MTDRLKELINEVYDPEIVEELIKICDEISEKYPGFARALIGTCDEVSEKCREFSTFLDTLIFWVAVFVSMLTKILI